MLTFRAEITDLLMRLWEGMQDSAMNCVLSLDGRLDEERLRRALRLTLDAEPILGCRFVERWYRPVWQRRDDLDRLELLRVVPGEAESAVPRFLNETLDDERDCQVRGELVRGTRDTLCLKFSHRIGDAHAFKQYMGLLVETYNRLEQDPSHRPPPAPSTDRSLLQIAPDRARLSEARRQAREHRPWLTGDAARWNPGSRSGPSEPAVHLRRLDAARFKQLFKRAQSLRVTTFHLLVGAMFLTARDLLPHSAGTTLPLWCVVDLRRFGALGDRPALCNLFGLMHVWLPAGGDGRLSETAVRVREQVMAMQRRLGLTEPPFRLESDPRMRFLLGCLPYSWMKALVRRRLNRVEAGIYMLTDIGALDEARLAFRGAPPNGAYVASGMVRNPRVLLLCVSQFRDSLTITSNVARALPMDELLDGMLERIFTDEEARSDAV